MSGLVTTVIPVDRAGRVTPWASGWRRRWFATVGTVVALPRRSALCLIHSPGRAAHTRDDLLALLTARPNRIADVLAACQAHARAVDRQLVGGRR